MALLLSSVANDAACCVFEDSHCTVFWYRMIVWSTTIYFESIVIVFPIKLSYLYIGTVCGPPCTVSFNTALNCLSLRVRHSRIAVVISFQVLFRDLAAMLGMNVV